MNRDFVIVTDNTSDLPENYIIENNLSMLKITYTIDGETYGTDKNMEPREFYKRMRAGSMSQTQQVNPQNCYELFEKLVAEGKDILYIAFSSGLSGSYASSIIARDEIAEKHPEAQVVVVDSLCASLGEGLLVHKAVMLKKQGKTLQEIADWLNQNKLKLAHFFTVDDLFHLHRGGRVSKASAIVGSMLGIKPVLHVDDEGHLIPIEKVRGRKQSLNSLVDNMIRLTENIENDIIFISHGDCEEDARYVEDLIKQKTGINSFLINFIGPSIGSHSGPGTVALFFMAKSRL